MKRVLFLDCCKLDFAALVNRQCNLTSRYRVRPDGCYDYNPDVSHYRVRPDGCYDYNPTT